MGGTPFTYTKRKTVYDFICIQTISQLIPEAKGKKASEFHLYSNNQPLL